MKSLMRYVLDSVTVSRGGCSNAQHREVYPGCAVICIRLEKSRLKRCGGPYIDDAVACGLLASDAAVLPPIEYIPVL